MTPNPRGDTAVTDQPEPDDDANALEHDRDYHRSLARRYRDQAKQAAAQQDRAATAQWLEEADRLDALSSEDDRKLRAIRDRQRHATARAMAATRQAPPADLTR
jgi:hypothetical protein